MIYIFFIFGFPFIVFWDKDFIFNLYNKDFYVSKTGIDVYYPLFVYDNELKGPVRLLGSNKVRLCHQILILWKGFTLNL